MTLLSTQSAQAVDSYWYNTDSSVTKIQFTNQYVPARTISPPASANGSTISTVQWSYGEFNPPALPGRSSRLCDITTSQCVSLQGNSNGTTSFFAGRPGTDTFRFEFAVITSGSYNKQWQVYAKTITVFTTT